MMDVIDMTVQELLQEWKHLSKVIEPNGAFSGADIQRMNEIEEELDKREGGVL